MNLRIFLQLSLLSFAYAKVKNFRVSSEITTGWSFCRNQALYISEFLYSIDKEAFWKFFKDLNQEHSVKDVGKSSVQDQAFLLDKTMTKLFSRRSNIVHLLKINLEMETPAPRLEALSQSQSSIDMDCEAFVEYEKGRFTCSLKFLEEKNFDFAGIGNYLSTFDYIYNDGHKRDSSEKYFRIYTIAGSALFNDFFLALSEHGFSVAVQLLVKPTNCPFYREEVHPTGYGLEFELKSSQYVVEEEQEELPDDDIESSNHTNLLKSMTEPISPFKNIKQVPNYQARALKSLQEASSFDDILNVSTNLLLLTDKLKSTKPASNVFAPNQVESVFRINHLDMKAGSIDPFKILDFMNLFLEMTIEGEALKLSPGILKELLKSRLQSSAQPSSSTSNIFYNIQSESITFLNNLEKDLRYSKWEKFLKQATSEGQFHAKNILTVVFPLDFDAEGSGSLLDNLVQLISYGYPMRFAILPIVSDPMDPFVKAFFAVRQSHGLRASVSFIKNLLQISHQHPDAESKEKIVEYITNELGIRIDLSANECILTKMAHELTAKFNLKDFNGVFANGKAFPFTPNLLEDLMRFYSEELYFILEHDLGYDESEIYNDLLVLKNAKSQRFIIDSRFEGDHILPIESIISLTEVKNYIEPIETDGLKLTSWLAADFNNKPTFSFFIHLLKSSVSKMSRIRVFVNNPMTSMANRIVLATSGILKGQSLNEAQRAIVIKFLERFEENYFSDELQENNSDLFTREDQQDPIIKELLKYAANLNLVDDIVRENAVVFSIYSKLIDFKSFFLFSINGNSLKITPLEGGAERACQYLEEFVREELTERAGRFYRIANKENLIAIEAVLIYSLMERKLLKRLDERMPSFISSLVPGAMPNTGTLPIEIGDEETCIFRVEALFNPFNREGQKFSSIMSYFSNSGLFSFSLYLIGDEGASDPKESRIYRFVTPETKATALPIIPVSDPETLLALTLDLPSAWMIIATYSNADLDNIRPMKVPHLQASFALTKITLEGQVVFDGKDQEVATGKIVQLFSQESGLLKDETSVMANYGYFQLKGTPDVYIIRVIDEEWEYPIVDDSSEIVSISSFSGKFKRIKISKDNRIKINSHSRPTSKMADINVFSLASGLFYERLLRIMIRSVLKKKNSEASVKFWFLETTLSAKGALALDILAKELGFEYELMAYNWPSWLNPQSKKHRTIWAYKILFLDVLFPQNLERIIFIDADQVVRSDLMELVELDLKGHVYAMTPFCNDKDEMAPFRFWEHNYWKNHLEGRPYHISALFVVDLKELRKKYVADIIRSQYNALSKDPNSLANLDQDLPNNLQNHIPIFSLPQEWLWCDTWCPKSTFSRAKTIDLCNNPKTFESKLDQALRIIPEWKEYDEEVKNILKKSTPHEFQKNLKSTSEFIEHYDL